MRWEMPWAKRTSAKAWRMFSNPTGDWGCPIASACSWAAAASIFSSRGTANMKALLLTEYMNLQVTELAEPEIGAADVLVRVRACGICGSDVHGLDGRTGRRIPPLVMGHEALTPAWRPIARAATA